MFAAELYDARISRFVCLTSILSYERCFPLW